MRFVLLALVWSPSLALAGGAPTDGINWFTIGDPHSLAMGWFILNFILFITGASFVIRGPIMRQVRARAERKIAVHVRHLPRRRRVGRRAPRSECPLLGRRRRARRRRLARR